jgi:predicted nucleic acid-binding protein
MFSFMPSVGSRSNVWSFSSVVPREEVYGVTTIEAINEVTHRLMLAEALATGVIRRARAQDLRGKTEAIRRLRQYWAHVDKIFNLNILILKPGEHRLHRAHAIRSRHELLTNDSLILSAMNEYGIGCLATRDGDFDDVAQLTVYKPTDI